MSELPTKLESAGINLNTIGLGIEHFAKRNRKLSNESMYANIKKNLDEAYKLGITHFDLVFNLPYFFDVFSRFIHKKRKEISFTAHLGNVYNDKKQVNLRTRSLRLIQDSLSCLLEKINTDYVDIALLQLVFNTKDYVDLIKKGNLKYAKQLKKDGQAKAIGVSVHNPELLVKILKENDFDVAMFTLNFATGVLDSAQNLIDVCKEMNTHLIAIKTLLKGKVFSTRSSNYPAYMCSGQRFALKLDKPTSASECFNYALDKGADTVVFGVKNVDELRINMKSYHSGIENKNYSKIVSIFKNNNRLGY